MKTFSRDAAFWIAVALVSIAASSLVKILAARSPWPAFQEFAATT